MRTILTQDHATNLRDLILNYGLDREDARIIDFTYGKGGLWKAVIYEDNKPKRYPYKVKLTKCDAVPTEPDVVTKNFFTDDYSDLGMFEAGVFDLPYLYGHQAFDYSLKPMQKQGPNSWSNDPRFTQNKNPQDFIDRVKGISRVANQCIKPNGLLFCKVMDTRHKTKLVLNHVLIINNLENFECHAISPYLAGGSKTWRNHMETSHGYWMVFKRLLAQERLQL